MHLEKEFYTHGHSRPVVQSHASRSVADSARFLVPYLTAGIELLDFGCGPGSITADLGNYVGASGRVVGVDSSRDAIAVAGHQHPAPNVWYLQASVYDLPFPDGSFDVAYGHQVLQHLADPVTALVEIHRVLRPGGHVAVRDADYGSMVHHPHYPELDRWLDVYHRVARHNGGEPDAGRRLQEWVTAAGFTDVCATASTWHYTTPEQRQEWATLWADRIRFARFAERAAIIDESANVEEMARAWLQWADEPAGWFAFLHGEVVATRI
jgi:ubiquinone/menaquinone biosynthesis C-methylase UbiE